MENLEFIKEIIKKYNVFIAFFILSLVVLFFPHAHLLAKNFEPKSSCLWEICSIDTMKTSRDLAREKVNDHRYDSQIKTAVDQVKATGANYITIGTPYDSEFLPYLKKWIAAAREDDLNVWFRGNWSSWEGWFDYPKNLTPDLHIQKTYDFIIANPDLFSDGDIFDACPECENAKFWPQPDKNNEYNDFLRKQTSSLNKAFEKINKKVKSNIASIIGGRAKEVVDQKTFDSLGNVISIDHYFKDPANITEYINYFFNDHGTRVLVSEFGAPIPDINGYMTEDQQAQYVEDVLNNMYRQNGKIVGASYWVLSDGTTALVNPGGTTRKAYDVLQKYYTPGIIIGSVTDDLGKKLKNITLRTTDGIEIKTDGAGKYMLAVPARKITLETGGSKYFRVGKLIEIQENGQKITANFILKPTKPDLEYKIRRFLQQIF